MSASPKSPDYFAEIATAIPTAARPGLAPTARDEVPARDLPLTPGATVPPAPAPRIATATQLADALAEMRTRFEPFTADLAPPLESTRGEFELTSFQWRIEEPADRANFPGTLAGNGTWTQVELPHYGPPLGRAVTLYRAIFDLPPAVVARECVILRFLGVDYKCQAYLNGVDVGQHEGFFEAFEFDCTGVARAQGNVLLVRVQNDFTMLGSQKDGRATTGDKIYAGTGLGYDEPEHGWHHCPPAMGIYNRVRFEGRSRLHLSDLWVRPLPAQESVEVRAEIENLSPEANVDFSLLVSIHGQNFSAAIHRDVPHRPVGHTVRGFGDLDGDHSAAIPSQLGLGVNFFVVTLPLPAARRWELETPWLYQAQVKLVDADNRVLDTGRVQFGVRTFIQDETSSPRGQFRLNDRPIRLRGANTMGHLERCIMRGDLAQLRDDILLAKLTHLNFLRLTQRPVHREVYEWCDRLGLMLQTDLPMFATVRRNQFQEVTRQCSRMERHVRAHPSNVIVSFINEPRPAAAGKPHRFLLRDELERLFVVSSEAVRQENPDRVIKCVDGDYDPPSALGMPDNHCYPGWYIGHGVDLGALHHGEWLNVKPGWYYGCGEFGAEGLDSFGVMRKYYPAAWQPAAPNSPWSPEVISEAQSWNFHLLWYPTPRTAQEWIEASQDHQAWVTRLMTEAFRRKAQMNTFAIHLFIDAWPAGWMKTIMDVDRVPKKAWFAYRDALAPLSLSLRCDRTQAWSGETVPVEVWVCNDLPESMPGCRIHYHVSVDDQVIAHGIVDADIGAGTPRGQGAIALKIPSVKGRGEVSVRAALVKGEATLHDTHLSLTVFTVEEEIPSEVVVIDSNADLKEFVNALGLTPASGPATPGSVLLFADHAAYAQRAAEVDAAVRAGAVAVFLQLPPGKYEFGSAPLDVRTAGMGPRHFVSIDTGHPLVADFAPHDFKFWHSARLGRPIPILHTTLDAPEWTPILLTGDGGWIRPWTHVPAAVERRVGRGAWRVCQVELTECVATNPVAAQFARRLMSPLPET